MHSKFPTFFKHNIQKWSPNKNQSKPIKLRAWKEKNKQLNYQERTWKKNLVAWRRRLTNSIFTRLCCSLFWVILVLYPNFNLSDINIVYTFEFMGSTFVDRDGIVEGKLKTKNKGKWSDFQTKSQLGKRAESDRKIFVQYYSQLLLNSIFPYLFTRGNFIVPVSFSSCYITLFS